MVTARTTTDYINANQQVFGTHLDRYTDYLINGGKSKGGAEHIRKYIRAFLARCPPCRPEEITAEKMAEVCTVMENDGLIERYRNESLIHTGRFLEFVTGSNPYNRIDPESKERWFVGHMGEFRFQSQLDSYIRMLEDTGLSKDSVRRKRIHAVTCCRVLHKERNILFLSQVDESCFWYLEGLMEGLSDAIVNKILFDFDEFLRYSCQKTLLKRYKKRKFPIKAFEQTEEWQEFMTLVDAYVKDMEERGLRPRSIQGIRYSVIEGYETILDRFGPVRLKDIDYHHIRELKKNLPDLKQRTVRIYLGRLCKLIEFHYGYDPYRRANLVWSPEQVNRTWIFKAQWRILWDSSDVTERLVLALAGGMGLRRAEIAGLRLSDISGSRMTIRGKGHGPNGKVVEKEIPPTVIRCIGEYLKVRESIIAESGDYSNGNLIVMDAMRKGADATIRKVESIIQGISAKTGIEVTCHTLRRFYCMALVDAGTDMDTVRRMMRHENIETTFGCYVNADPRKLANATETVEGAIFG